MAQARRQDAGGAQEARLLQLDAQLCFAVYAAAQAFTATYRPLLEPMGLTYPQYLTMLVLWEEDGLTVSAIGERLGLDSGTLTPLLKRLEAAGLVIRSRDGRDERQVRVRLTPAGQALAARAAGISERIGCATGLPFSELADLRDRLQALRQALAARG